VSSGHSKRRPLGRSFWTVWTAATSSNIGDGIVLAALPLLAASLTREPVAVAATTIAIRLPWLLFGLFAGVIVDRTDRLRLMIGTDLGRAVAFAAIAVVVATDNMTLLILYAAVFGVGVLETIFDTAGMSLTPALVEPDQLEHANARISGAYIAANELVGPPVGAALFAIAAVVPSVISDIREGFGFLWREPVIRAFAIGAGVLNLGMTAGVSVLVLHAQDNLSLDELGFGLLLVAAAIGGISGAQVAPSVIYKLGRAPSVLASVVAIAAGIAIMGVANNLWVAGSGFALFGFAGEIWNIVSVTYRQAATPDAMLGRVMSGFRVIAYGAFPIGAALGGLIASAVNLRASFFVGAGLVVALLPYLIHVTNRHTLDPTTAAPT
jgi:MFS family permease